MYELKTQREICRRYLHQFEPRSPTLGRLRSVHKSRNDSFKHRRNVLKSHRRTHTYRMTDGGVQHSGYIDIKQPPKVKGRKLKSWKKKWVVLQEIEIRSAGDKSAAKVDVYVDERTAATSPSDKHTFILEYVSEIRAAKSKTHDHAFEIVENEAAVLLLSGATELETQTWIAAFRKIFWPNDTDDDTFMVEILPNEHTARLSLQGVYRMTVNPEVVAIHSEQCNSYEWSLNTLKRFHVQKCAINPDIESLVIECGPKSECGEATFIFTSDHVGKILESIKKNIFIAINQKKNDKQSKVNSTLKGGDDRVSDSNNINNNNVSISGKTRDVDRVRSITCSSSELRFRDLLETSGSKNEIPETQSSTRVSRMTSHQSEQSQDSNSVLSDGTPPEIPKKKRHSVTFDTTCALLKASTEALASQIDIYDTETSTEYNKVEFKTVHASKSFDNIVSTITVAKAGYETKVLLDDKGYSHVDMKGGKPVLPKDDKSRSLSNLSSHSSMSCRSASVGSRDSGILYSNTDKTDIDHRQQHVSNHRSTNSFDSAVSTSSVVEQTESTSVLTSPLKPSIASGITVEIQEIEVNACDGIPVDSAVDVNVHQSGSTVYQDVPNVEDYVQTNEKDKIYASPSLKKSSSTGNVERMENHYEDLDVFRRGKKNLVKHLGMDPAIDPKSVPPSLPERPSSHKLRRKFNANEKRLFTLPFRNKKKMRERAASISSSSSSSDDGNAGGKDQKKKGKMAVKAWPLGNKSVTVANEDLYQPIAIERFLKDNDGTVSGPQKRERSCSLNLNTANMTMKRPSLQSTSVVERGNAMWKHNRNVSLQMDMLHRITDSDSSILTMGMAQGFDTSLNPVLLHERHSCRMRDTFDDGVDEDSTFDGMCNETAIEDEPIYAELEPTRKMSDALSGECDNPFPNLTIWAPADISDVVEVSELNETKYENDDSMNMLNKENSDDVFNQGFVDGDEKGLDKSRSRNSGDVTSTIDDLLFDLNEPVHDTNTSNMINVGSGPNFFDRSLILPAKDSEHSTINKAPDFVDIFHLGTGNLLLPSEETPVDKSLHVTTNTGHDITTNESIYMDMSTCKNESIYVLPSSLKQPELK